jgi:hypothetical protein
MIIAAMVQLLLNAGYESGWALLGDQLTVWEHDQDPPAPLTRPEPTDETPNPD